MNVAVPEKRRIWKGGRKNSMPGSRTRENMKRPKNGFRWVGWAVRMRWRDVVRDFFADSHPESTPRGTSKRFKQWENLIRHPPGVYTMDLGMACRQVVQVLLSPGHPSRYRNQSALSFRGWEQGLAWTYRFGEISNLSHGQGHGITWQSPSEAYAQTVV